MDILKQKLTSVGQDHLLAFYDDLSQVQQSQLVEELQRIDWQDLTKVFREEVLPQLDTSGSSLKPASKIDDNLLEVLPDSCLAGTTRCSAEQLDHYEQIGLKHIKTGKVAALLLAGGQGTRLGFEHPKGMYDVGLPENKSLFRMQAERIQRLKQLAGDSARIIWYVMTSEATIDETRHFFQQQNLFGMDKNDVVFFEQGTMPCFGFDGRVLLHERHKLARSPNGNGGLFEALHEHNIIGHMAANGVEFLHVYCVDNILVRVCDPKFMGYCISKGAQAGAKVVEKVLPNEAVGTICKVGSQFKVIEYSEISDTIAERRDQATGKLAFNAGNICDHFFSVQFLDIIKGSDRRLRYHLAIKKVPHLNPTTGQRVAKPSEPCGIKLERFIFDVFEFTQQFAAWEVRREDEFSPLKNADGTQKDNPTTAREALLRANKLGLLDL